MNSLFKILLSPISLLYGISVSIRNLLYDAGLLKSAVFSVPVISVGNLTVGGEGKTPHVEYLIQFLQDYLDIAILSRGYKRKTKGFRVVQLNDKVTAAGDEPLQFKKKYPKNVVAVSESRALAIPEIMSRYPGTQAVVLDDAFQHLSVKPGLNILLTNFAKLFTDDYLLPSGRLREWRSAYKRADVIIVSKCPIYDPEINREQILNKINPLDHQKVFFSYYSYGHPYFMYDPSKRIDISRHPVILICAIAQADYMMSYLEEKTEVISFYKFEDHHYFTNHEVSLIKQTYEANKASNPIIITTEKDATRFHEHGKFIVENRLPFFILPAKVDFHFQQGTEFDNHIKDFLLNFRV